MYDFEKEQREILNLSDRIRNDKSLHTTEKHRRYVDVVINFLENHMSDDFEFIKHPYIEGFPRKFHLIMVKKGSTPVASGKTPSYSLRSIVALIEIRGHGLINYKHKLEEDVKAKRDRFEEIKKRSKNTKCLYLTLQEREVVIKGADYHGLSKKHLGVAYFSLRESRTQEVRDGEWKRFIKALLDP
jgi:hypothetical protein